MSSQSRELNRRTFIAKSAVMTAGSLAAIRSSQLVALAAEGETRQATGVKVGEVSDTSAIIWARLTAASARNNEGVAITGKGTRAGPLVTFRK